MLPHLTLWLPRLYYVLLYLTWCYFDLHCLVTLVYNLDLIMNAMMIFPLYLA